MCGIKKPRIKFDNEQHEKWFIENDTRILSINESVQSVTNYTIGETDKKSGVGVTTRAVSFENGVDKQEQPSFFEITVDRQASELFLHNH